MRVLEKPRMRLGMPSEQLATRGATISPETSVLDGSRKVASWLSMSPYPWGLTAWAGSAGEAVLA